MIGSKHYPVLLILTSVIFFRGPLGAIHPERVYIIENANSHESGLIAKYYADSRKIPYHNIIRVSLPLDEEICSSIFYEKIFNPIVKNLFNKKAIIGKIGTANATNGRLKFTIDDVFIDFLVTTMGVPLKMRHSDQVVQDRRKIDTVFRTSRGAVDSHIAQIVSKEMDLVGPVENPLFDRDYTLEDARTLALKVSRLDGPTLKHVINSLI